MYGLGAQLTDRILAQWRSQSASKRAYVTNTNADEELQRQIAEAFQRHPDLDARDILIKVKGDVVELGGYVRNFTEKRLAEKIVRDIHGVVVIAEDLVLKAPDCDTGTDPEIARGVAAMLHAPDCAEVQAVVHDRIVILSGRIGSAESRTALERRVRGVTGVRAVDSRVQVTDRECHSRGG